ncbi:MAG: UpxY family transcription antiterminator, partial [Bacteroidales bacterium]|nr:UpxY family transcription antiterminator [Bacteroidales bacterium]
MPEEKQWYVGYVRSCQERRVAAALQAAGEEYYLPVRKERRRWSDRVKTVEVLLLKGMVFIRTTNARRVPLLQGIYGLCAFMADRSTHHPVTIPE